MAGGMVVVVVVVVVVVANMAVAVPAVRASCCLR